MPNELLTVLAILQCALVICLPPGPSTLTTFSLSPPSSSSPTSYTELPFHYPHHSTLPLHQHHIYPLLHHRSYWPPPFAPDHRLLQRIHLLRNLNQLRYLQQLQNQLNYTLTVAQTSSQSAAHHQYVLHQTSAQHPLPTPYSSQQTSPNQVTRVQLPQHHTPRHFLSSSSSPIPSSFSAIPNYADNALQPLVPLAPSAITAIAFTPTKPLLTGSAKPHQTIVASDTLSKSSVKTLKPPLPFGSKPEQSGAFSLLPVVYTTSTVAPLRPTFNSTKATVHSSFTRPSLFRTLSVVDVPTVNRSLLTLSVRSSSASLPLVAGNGEILNTLRVEDQKPIDDVQPVGVPTDRLKLSSLSPAAVYLNLLQQSLLDPRFLEKSMTTSQQGVQQNRFVYDLVGTNRSLSKSLSGRKILQLAERTAPDTSAGMFSRALGTLSQYLPNSMRIGRTSGCVGGTKCQFFLSCWISSGSLGSSCGPLSTCCITPSKQDIQPAFYGPVVNDPHCGRSAARISRIVGGSDASFGQFPWQAFVQVGGSRCGGALVGQKHVVTAGHCVARSQHNPSDIRVTLGDYILNSDIESLPHELFSVAEVRLHPNFRFTPQADRYDVAILVLDRQVQYRNNIKPICLPQKDANFLGRVAYVAGWGALQAGSKLRPKVLQHVNVPVIDNNVCELWHRKRGINIKIHDEMMCAGYEFGGRDACQGDSGGPLMLNEYGVWYLIGIVSAGYSCAKQYQPGIYHRVSSSSDWVSANIYQNTN